MPKYFAFLQAVNVGSRKIIMSQLRNQFEGLDFTEVETFIASGNVIFSSPIQSTVELETVIMKMLKQNYAFDIETYVRTTHTISQLLALDPFPHNKVATTHSLHVDFFSLPLAPHTLEQTLSLQNSENDFHVVDNNLLWLNQKSIHETTVTYVQVEQAMGTKMTMRGINTLQRMIAKHPYVVGQTE